MKPSKAMVLMPGDSTRLLQTLLEGRLPCSFLFCVETKGCRHASFYLVDSKDVLSSFKLKPSELPVVYMVSSEGEGFMKYTGEILEMNLAEWVLRNSAPGLGELSVTSPSGKRHSLNCLILLMMFF